MTMKRVWIMTDMEGLAGVDDWEQCYAEADDDPRYQHGLEQLRGDTNAAVAGAFDAGAERVWVCDGHGRNCNRGLVEGLDPRAKRVWIESFAPVRFEQLDGDVDAVLMVGQHAMAGTVGGFLDHTEIPKTLCRFQIAGEEHGELGMLAFYAGAFGVPLVYASGDEALCAEAKRLLPGVVTTPTKRGLGWSRCDLYDPQAVREAMRRDVAAALAGHPPRPLQLSPPIEIDVEWAWSEHADRLAALPGVERVDGRRVRWWVDHGRDVFSWPSDKWQPRPLSDRAAPAAERGQS